MNSQFDRRTLLRTGALASISWRGMRADERPVKFPPTRAITRGPRKHWFGYYDKLQFDPTSR